MNNNTEHTAIRYRINSILIAVERGAPIRLDQWHRVLRVRGRLLNDRGELWDRINRAIEKVTEPCVHEGGAYAEGCGVCAPLWGRRIRLECLREGLGSV